MSRLYRSRCLSVSGDSNVAVPICPQPLCQPSVHPHHSLHPPVSFLFPASLFSYQFFLSLLPAVANQAPISFQVKTFTPSSEHNIRVIGSSWWCSVAASCSGTPSEQQKIFSSKCLNARTPLGDLMFPEKQKLDGKALLH